MYADLVVTSKPAGRVCVDCDRIILHFVGTLPKIRFLLLHLHMPFLRHCMGTLCFVSHACATLLRVISDTMDENHCIFAVS